MFFYSTDQPMPLPSTTAPPGVTDSGSLGDATLYYALGNHTHASKARKDRLQSNADGTITWTYSTPFGVGVIPRISAIAEVATGVTDIVNVQVIDTPTNTSCKLLVTRANRSVVALISLTVLSLPAQPGATWVHCLALEP